MNGGQFITTLYYADCAAYVAEIDAVAAGLAQIRGWDHPKGEPQPHDEHQRHAA